MNKGLVGGIAAGVMVLAAIVAAILVFGGGRAAEQVDGFVARLDLPPQVRVEYAQAAGSGLSDDIAVSGLRVTDTGTPDEEITVDELTLVALAGRDWPTGIEAEGVFAGTAADHVRIASFSASGIDPGTHLPSAARAEGIAGVSPFVGEITVESVELRDLDAAGQVPEHIDLAVRGIEARLDDAVSPVAGFLVPLGYDRLRVDLDYAYAFDPATNVLRVEGVRVAAQDMGTITVSAELGGVPPEAMTNPMLGAMAEEEVTLQGLELRYEDASLADRLLEMAARDEGLSTEEMRSQLIEAIQVETRTAGDRLTKEVLKAIQDFLAEPGTLRVVAEPPEPVKLSTLESLDDDPDKVRALLGLRVEAQ